MSATLDGITSNAITWEKDASDIKEDSKGKCTISVMGSVGNDDDHTSLEQAILLIPTLIPIGSNGPIGNSSRYSGAKLVGRAARYNGDGTIEVTANYEIATPENQTNPPDEEDGNSTSDSDRVARTSATEDAPILTHPIVRLFSATSRRNLASLLAGEIRVNPKYNEEGSDRELWEFIRDTEDGTDIEPVTFDSFEVSTLDRVTSSAIQYARLIASGIEVWKRPVVRHTITMARNEPVKDSEFGQVGEAMEVAPKGAPGATNGRQWFLNSISDSTENGESWSIVYEYELSGEGGVLKAIYPNGNAVIE